MFSAHHGSPDVAVASADLASGQAANPDVPSRRSVLRAAATVTIAGVAVTVLGACGGQSGAGAGGQVTHQPDLSDSAKAAIAKAVKAGEVPVGKSKIFADAGVIVSQPTAGSYVALSTYCPHAGGHVSEVSSRGFLRCPLHGSEFDPATGEVKVGPSAKGLGVQKIKVDGDKVTSA
ncbi:MAG: Rieske (2Fe-2S) protein [Austwickia sp.]|nr:MAG: Rieske (2Fe-2S) protein [Austwickia sp.]